MACTYQSPCLLVKSCRAAHDEIAPTPLGAVCQGTFVLPSGIRLDGSDAFRSGAPPGLPQLKLFQERSAFFLATGYGKHGLMRLHPAWLGLALLTSRSRLQQQSQDLRSLQQQLDGQHGTALQNNRWSERGARGYKFNTSVQWRYLKLRYLK